MIGYALWLIVGAQAASPAPARPVAAPVFRIVPPAVRRPVLYEAVGGLVVFRVRIAGREAWALLDNRAERSFVDLGFARQAGLTIDPRTSVRINAGSGLNGQRVERVAVAVEGQFAVTLASMTGIDLAPISRSIGRPIALVVGADFYRRFAVATRPGARTIAFLPGGTVERAGRAVDLLDARPRIAITLGGKRMIVTVDTGLSGALILTPAAWARLGVADAACEGSSFRTGDGRARTGRLCTGPAVSVGPLTLPSTRVFIDAVDGANGDGLIGMGLLGLAGGMTLDVSARKLWLVPPGEMVR
ncbi:aspartyl protease family protein [Sphingomonas sp. Leaf25]|uniref:aspartyl protease family protein n=1 Tax=Sphingomonas sp. Leaf25 TaxID=1735692 RepID=UPI000B1AADE7|nr:aspartyl protease family protein [Sphingomonas sp. Leaf25]